MRSETVHHSKGQTLIPKVRGPFGPLLAQKKKKKVPSKQDEQITLKNNVILKTRNL